MPPIIYCSDILFFTICLSFYIYFPKIFTILSKYYFGGVKPFRVGHGFRGGFFEGQQFTQGRGSSSQRRHSSQRPSMFLPSQRPRMFLSRELFPPPFKLQGGLPCGKIGHIAAYMPRLASLNARSRRHGPARNLLVVLPQAARHVHGGAHISRALAALQEIDEEFFGFYFTLSSCLFVVHVLNIFFDLILHSG